MKNGIRNSKFSIVIHDVTSGDHKKMAEAWVISKQPRWSLVAEEEYNHQEGYHLHIFIEFDPKIPRAWKPLLKELERLFPAVKPDGSRAHRIQVDYGRGSFDECQKYLQGATKDKKIDSDITVELSYPELSRLVDEYKETLFDYDLSLVENIRQYLDPSIPPHLFAQYKKKNDARIKDGELKLEEMRAKRRAQGPIVLDKSLVEKKIRKCRLLDLITEVCGNSQ